MSARTERLFLHLDGDGTQGPESGVPAATLKALPVPVGARHLLASAVVYDECFAPGVETVERVVPDGAVRLVLPWGNGHTAGLVPGSRVSVIGPSGDPATLVLGGHMAGLTLTLQPGAALPLLGMPASELAGRVLALEDVVPARTRLAQALGRLGDACTRTPRAMDPGATLDTALETELAAVCADTPGPLPARTQAAWQRLLAGDCRHARDLGRALDLSERRLQALFAQAFGLPPRTLIRLQQLRRCLALRRRHPGMGWAELAVAAGFYDQPHLNRAFRDFCGVTPQAFTRLSASGSSKTG